MSRNLSRIDERAARLLCNIVESPSARISGAVLHDYHSASASDLIGAELLVPDAPVPAATSLVDHDDEPVALLWSPERRGYGYFNPNAGWVTVAPEKLHPHRVDMAAFIRRLTQRLDLPTRSRPVERIAGILWEIGNTRLPGRGGRVPIWFARRLSDAGAWRQIVGYLTRRPPADFRVLITTSPTANLPASELPRHELIALADLEDHAVGLVVEPSYLAAQLQAGSSSRSADPVRHAAGFRHVWVGEREFRFGGDKQRQIVEYLFNAWEAGEESVSVAEMFTDLDFDGSSRVRDIFKGHPDWKDLIEVRGGACRLRVRELLDGQAVNDD